MKLSVAMCTYNGERHIEKQLASILNQTIAIDEIVICDDGSNDKTIQIIEQFQLQYPAIISLYKNEVTLGSNKNFEKAISICSGDYIFLSDQDDIWKNIKVEKIIQFFNENKSMEGVFSNADLINEKGDFFTKNSLWDTVFFMENQLQKPIDLCSFIISIKNIVTGATLCFKKEIKNSIFPFPVAPEFYHDEWIAIFIASRKKLGYITDHLISYRIHENQQTSIDHNLHKPVIDHQLEISKFILGEIIPKTHGDFKKIKKSYFDNHIKFKTITDNLKNEYEFNFKEITESNLVLYKKQNTIMRKANPILYFFRKLKYGLKGEQF